MQVVLAWHRLLLPKPHATHSRPSFLQDLHLRSRLFWERFDALEQLEALHTAQAEMEHVEATFGMSKPFEGMTLKQRERAFHSSHRALTLWIRGLSSRVFLSWRQHIVATKKLEGK